jgi:hypothetical protein
MTNQSPEAEPVAWSVRRQDNGEHMTVSYSKENTDAFVRAVKTGICESVPLYGPEALASEREKREAAEREHQMWRDHFDGKHGADLSHPLCHHCLSVRATNRAEAAEKRVHELETGVAGTFEKKIYGLEKALAEAKSQEHDDWIQRRVLLREQAEQAIRERDEARAERDAALDAAAKARGEALANEIEAGARFTDAECKKMLKAMAQALADAPMDNVLACIRKERKP